MYTQTHFQKCKKNIFDFPEYRLARNKKSQSYTKTNYQPNIKTYRYVTTDLVVCHINDYCSIRFRGP